MARNKPKIWNDGLKGIKTATNPKGGGRVRGRDYSYTNRYPGVTAEHRLSYCRMKAQAKFRDEPWNLTWEQYQEIWADKWHLRGRQPGDLCLTRIDWEGVWDIDNVSIVDRETHWKKQGIMTKAKNRRR